MDDDLSTDELKHQQEARERAEREGAAEAIDEAEQATHLRRAEKAAYLQQKLGEREQSEADVEDETSSGER
jgi:hypothetical protein